MPRLKTFSWKDCGSASDPAHIESVATSPDPIKLPGKILLFMNMNKISFSFLSKKQAILQSAQNLLLQQDKELIFPYADSDVYE